MATIDFVAKKVISELDSRNLQSRARYSALNKVVSFIKEFYGGQDNCLDMNKSMFVEKFERATGSRSQAARSVINELYHQYGNSGTPAPKTVSSLSSHEGRKDSDEYYVIDLCDEVLSMKALRQHRFPFLLGDSGRPLPVDSYYESLSLVVEYCESQHTEAVPFFDKKETVSGVSRGVQRRIYDERRDTILPQHGIRVVRIHYSDFGTSKKLRRNKEHDKAVVSSILKDYIN